MNALLRDRLDAVNSRIFSACRRAGRSSEEVRLIAVTKTHPVATIQDLADLGVRDFGESRAGELEEKAHQIPGNCSLHMIGHLQTNKVARILPFVEWIQSIDRERLIERIEFLGTGTRKIKALVEVNTSGEQSKTGCSVEQCRNLCERVALSKSLDFKGLMTIGPLHEDEIRTREAFRLLRSLGEQVRDLTPQPELSMGMSGDFEWAIEEGATMVRIGTLLVGERPR